MKKIFFVSCLVFILTNAFSQSRFYVNPYLQIGNNPNPRSLTLMWQTLDENSSWKVQYLSVSGKIEIDQKNIQMKKVNLSGFPVHFIYNTTLNNLKPNSTFEYSIFQDDKVVFTSNAQSPPEAGQTFKFAVFGDVGTGNKQAIEIANGIFKSDASLVLIPGDIVYNNGLSKEYQKKFWPIYNASKIDTTGFPIMSRIPFVASTGNHDADTRDLDKYPDALAYYYYWKQPLNGPILTEGTPLLPYLKASELNRNAFIQSAGDQYPGMTNFSYTYGNTHWIIIDVDNYVDVTDTTLTNWIRKDLADAGNIEWKFVMFHHPGFNSSIEHYEQQQSRLLAPIFENGKVDIVFNGHVHNYQRSYPLTFKPQGKGIQLIGGKDGSSPRGKIVNGTWTLDKAFDGTTITKAKGVIYLVTGAGGQVLYNPEQQVLKDTWQGFTKEFISKVHSFTLAKVNGKSITVEQKDANGNTLDSFTLTH